MTITNPAKFWLLFLITVGLFTLILTGDTTLNDVDQYLTLILGYGVGNGINALRGTQPSPLFARKATDQDTFGGRS
ncbi:MAG: hypothetical protein KDB40_11025 [Acidimicrobiales bacterium]|nr:hypothetical protein [Acidimicrobiales bacterium]MCB9393811.1 hypothetical protein [Acidimicrobiaceae bacterium]